MTKKYVDLNKTKLRSARKRLRAIDKIQPSSAEPDDQYYAMLEMLIYIKSKSKERRAW